MQIAHRDVIYWFDLKQNNKPADNHVAPAQRPMPLLAAGAGAAGGTAADARTASSSLGTLCR